MPTNSPPKHRHDGTSPLPLGMDWSPPPKKWDGKNTVWPHDPHAGWSYCVMIPSWIVQPESGAFNGSLLNSIIFFRVLVGMQSPEGISSSYVILRRFSDFMKLFSAIKRAFPRKNIPPAPPKHSLMKVNSSRLLLEERRYALEEWIGKLLSDVDLSRSVPVAAFLKLEAAVRSSFEDVSQHALETSLSGNAIGKAPSLLNRPSSGGSVADTAVSSKLQSIRSELGRDNAYETFSVETSRQGKVHISDGSTEDFLSVHALNAPSKSLDNGFLLDKSEQLFKSKLQQRKENLVSGRDDFCNSSEEPIRSGDRMELTLQQDHAKQFGHARNLSAESSGSDTSSIRGSESSNPSTTNSLGDGSVDLAGGAEASDSMEAFSSMEMQFMNDTLIINPLDQQHKLNRILATMQQRLMTAKTDMKYLIARLNQEIAVKKYLTAKVKDLEVELEETKQKSQEDLQQAILLERERVTQIQWDTDELCRKYFEMESKLEFEQSEKARAESEKITACGEKELLLQELDNKTEQLKDLEKHLDELEMKSKADIKVLVKEVKILRSSQLELKEVLNQSLKEKNELERVLQKEKQRRAHDNLARKKFLNECGVLHHRLQESSANFLAEGEDKFTVNPSSLSDALGLLTTSDTRIGLLLAEAQLLGRDNEHAITIVDGILSSGFSETVTAFSGDDNPKATSDDEMRRMLSETFIDNARLRKQVNSVVRCALKTIIKPVKEDSGKAPSRKTVLNKFLQR